MDLESLLSKKKIYTVSEITKEIKLLIVDNFYDIWIRGELSNCRTAHSGHIYFTLKDEYSVIKAVFFKKFHNEIKFELEDGMKVIVHGELDIYEKRGEYQVIVDYIEPEGIGALQIAFQQLKEKLEKEGLFSPEHKMPIPPFPEKIGVITSPTGAAIRDILNVINRRYRGVHIIIYPTLVQGEGAAEEIVSAINTANERKEVDVLILARGGGSIEDLWAFNEEKVARAIYSSEIPIISAVGHEIDTTISDLVADLRAPTPSAAAELVVKNKSELATHFKDLVQRMLNRMTSIVNQKKDTLSHYSEEILERRIKNIIVNKTMIFDDISKALDNSFENIINNYKNRFKQGVAKLESLSPLSTLARGYSIVTKPPKKTPIKSIRFISSGDLVLTLLADGEFESRVIRVDKEIRRVKG